MADAVRVAAPAKVNLRLKVLAREASGYHALETLFCAISLADSITVRRAAGQGIALAVHGHRGDDLGPPEQNLCVRAAERFFAALGEPARVRIELEKHIPAAAGLGGGSSDAAATLRALNALHGEPLSRDALLQIATLLGSDVPFFLCGSPYALAWSRGERLLALPPLPPRPVLIAHPGEAVSTADAFRAIAACRGGAYVPVATSIPLEALTSWNTVAGLATSDFEPSALASIPRLASALERMRQAGAAVALLAGSGASVFGIFDDVRARDRAAAELESTGFAAWRAETLQRMPEPERVHTVQPDSVVG